MHIQVQFLNSKWDYKQLKYYETHESVLEFPHSTIKKELGRHDGKTALNVSLTKLISSTCFMLVWKLQRHTHEIHLIASPTTPTYKTDKLKTKPNSLNYKLVRAEILRILAFRSLLESFYNSFRTEESWMTSSRRCSSIQTIKKIIHILYLLWPRLWIRFLFSDVRFHLTIPNQSTQTMQWQSSGRKIIPLGRRTVCWECSGECQLENWI